jgi:uncharacterized membrane protein
VKQESPITEFNIRPNAGYPRPGWPWLMAGLVVIGLGIAIRLTLMGFWMVLPFTLFELALVYFLVRLVRRRGNYIEKIRIDGERLSIQHIQPGQDRDWWFPLHWVSVDLRAPRYRWYPHRLLLGASGRWVEVGACLTDEERLSLADAVREEIRRMREPEHLRDA